MAKYLVIVESPAKVKTIKKFLGKNYEVMASQGHVRDLPKSQLGFDPKDDYEPKYITIRGKGDLLAALRKEAKKADKIYLATDPDREGEAISWHLTKALKLEEKSVARITFNEITKTAVKNSLKNPREIDMNLVDSQQARRMLDRMVGYRISPLLWAKVKRGLSAGRVQSVAMRIICDREDEINSFIPQEYYTLDVNLKNKDTGKDFSAKFYGDKNGKLEISDKSSLDAIISSLDSADYKVSTVKIGSREKKAPLPFTTSTLQQEASKALNFSISKTMRVAQQLYEGIDIKGEGTVGLITYLRTDSTRVSDEAKAAAADFISSNYGSDYLAASAGASKKATGKVQDAHEAIRPSDINRTPADVKDSISRDQSRLYQLIWKRFVASQMSSANYETANAKIAAGDYVFTVADSKRLFDGFMLVYTDAEEEKEDKKLAAHSLSEGTALGFVNFDEQRHETQPKPHFTEASLVRTLEELGIGRPSTYSPTISTLQKRRYISKEGRNLFVTELGDVVNSIMKDSFPTIVDDAFTANLESLLDHIEEGTVSWKSVIANFYPDLEAAVKIAEKDLAQVKVADEVTDVICEECGRNMVVKYGPHGKFLACPGFPECRNTKPFLERIGVPCPNCGKDVVAKKSKKGRRFFGCEANPDCYFMSWSQPVEKKCPDCGGYMVIRGNKLACENSQCRHVEAR